MSTRQSSLPWQPRSGMSLPLLTVQCQHTHPFFILLEIIPWTPRLQADTLMVDLYLDDTKGVCKGLKDWVMHVMDMECQKKRHAILKATSVLWRLELKKHTRDNLYESFIGRDFLSDVLRFWPEGESIPIALLDQLNAAASLRPQVMGLFECKCSNRADVAMWSIQNNIDICDHLGDAMSNAFPVDVVIAYAEYVVKNRIIYSGQFSEAVGEAMRLGGRYMNKRLLHFLWKNSKFEVRLDTYWPTSLKSYVVTEARIQPDITLKTTSPRFDLNLLLRILAAMQQSTALTQWALLIDGDPSGYVDEVCNVLYQQCSSLRELRIASTDAMSLRIPEMSSLDLVHLHKAVFPVGSLEPIMSNAKEIRLNKCALQFPSEEAARLTGEAEPPDCLEGWTRGLAKNNRIEKLTINHAVARGWLRVSWGGFFEQGLCTRSTLRELTLTCETDNSEEALFFNFKPEDMQHFCKMESLEKLELDSVPPFGLRSLSLRPLPNLQSLELTCSSSWTKEDYLGYLDLLAHPKCKVKYCMVAFNYTEVLFLEGDDERLKDPLQSLIDVVRDQNSTLERIWIRPKTFQGESAELDLEEKLAFWIGMNNTCPNRLDLRKQLSSSYADQIAKYANGRSYSEAFELIRSTFHFWGRCESQNDVPSP